MAELYDLKEYIMKKLNIILKKVGSYEGRERSVDGERGEEVARDSEPKPEIEHEEEHQEVLGAAETSKAGANGVDEFTKPAIRSLSLGAGTPIRGPHLGDMSDIEPLPQRKASERPYPRAVSTPICKRRNLEEPVVAKDRLMFEGRDLEIKIAANAANGVEPEVAIRVGSTPVNVMMSESFGAALPSSDGDDSRSFASLMDLDTSTRSRKRKNNTSPTKGPKSSGDEDLPIRLNRKRKPGRVIRDETMSKSPVIGGTPIPDVSLTQRKEREELEIEGDGSSDEVYRRFAAVDIIEDRINAWLLDVDKLRSKSRNINGKVSGDMKQKLRYSRLAVKDFIQRSNPSEDATLLRMRNSELAAEPKEA